MPALDFPDSPELNESFVGPSGKQWIWNGSRWQAAQETILTTAVEYVQSLVAGTGINLANNGGTASTPTVSVNTSTIATKSYVDSVAAGLNWHEAARLSTAAQLPDSPAYSNGTSGVGATLTATTNARLLVDGTNASNGDRILVKNESDQTRNGIYVVTDQGSVSTTWILTRSDDFDGSPAGEISAGEAVFVTSGATNIRQGYVLTSYGTGSGNSHLLGTDNLTFTQFTGAQAIVAGDGLSSTGNTINIGTANVGRIVVNAENIDLATVAQSNTSQANTVTFVQSVNVDSYGRVAGQTTANVDLSSTIAKSVVQAKGDLIVGTNNSAVSRLQAAEDGYFLKVDSNQATGLVWSQIDYVPSINNMGDVDTTSAASGQFLKFNGTTWSGDAIDLGTDTTGDYVQYLSAGTGVFLQNNSGEGSIPTVAIGQDVSTNASPSFAGLTITGNLNVAGTTTVINSTVVSVDDPILTLGGDTAPESDDNKDRGVEFRWHDGAAAKVGFFGFDDSTGRFTFIPDATNTSEVFSGTLGTIDVGDVLISGTASTGTGGVVRSNGATLTGNVILPSTTRLLEDYLSLTSNTTLSLASHQFKFLEVNSASAVTITVPTNAAEAFPIGTVISIARIGTGEVTISNSSGVVINNPLGARLRVQWSTATLRKRGTDTWLLSGDLKV